MLSEKRSTTDDFPTSESPTSKNFKIRSNGDRTLYFAVNESCWWLVNDVVDVGRLVTEFWLRFEDELFFLLLFLDGIFDPDRGFNNSTVYKTLVLEAAKSLCTTLNLFWIYIIITHWLCTIEGVQNKIQSFKNCRFKSLRVNRSLLLITTDSKVLHLHQEGGGGQFKDPCCSHPQLTVHL